MIHSKIHVNHKSHISIGIDTIEDDGNGKTRCMMAEFFRK